MCQVIPAEPVLHLLFFILCAKSLSSHLKKPALLAASLRLLLCGISWYAERRGRVLERQSWMQCFVCWLKCHRDPFLGWQIVGTRQFPKTTQMVFPLSFFLLLFFFLVFFVLPSSWVQCSLEREEEPWARAGFPRCGAALGVPISALTQRCSVSLRWAFWALSTLQCTGTPGSRAWEWGFVWERPLL